MEGELTKPNQSLFVKSSTTPSRRVRLLELNRPRVMHAMSRAMSVELFQALAEASQSEEIRVIVITGSDGCSVPSFCAGADVKELKDMDPASAFREQWLESWASSFATIRKPVIAAVNGLALGGGCELALLCDVVFCAESASFGLPEVTLGTIPGAGGTGRLLRAVGKSRAMELILTAGRIDAHEAAERGLVSRVFADAELMCKVYSVAEKMAEFGPNTIAMAKEAVNATESATLREGLNLERKLYWLSFGTDEFREGTAAFLEKRKANF